MARPTRDAVETFMRITGASHSLALRKLEEYGGNLDEAVNAHFSEMEGHTTNRMSAVSSHHNFMDTRNQMHDEPRGVLPLVSAARSFKPSLLLDSNYRRNLLNQIGASLFPSHEPRLSYTGEFNNGYDQPYHSGPRPVNGAVSATPLPEHYYSGPRPANGAVSATPLPPGPQSQGNILRDDELHMHGNNVEEEIIQLAIEASKQERQLDLEDDELARALSLSLKTAEQEKAMRERTVEDKKQPVGLDASGGRAEETNIGIRKSGSSSLQDRAEDVQKQPLWGGISSEELDEAFLLEAALFGEISEGTSSQRAPHLQGAPDKCTGLNPLHVPHRPSPSVVAERLLREQQDDEYLASLLADRQKETDALKEAETCSKEGESHNKMIGGEEFEILLAAKEASLPQEPSIDNEDGITLLIRMPDGSRCGHRFLKSDKLQFLFDFIDAGRAVKPGSYRVVRPYPRRAFSVGDSSLSLNELGLTNKQEALFLELI